jgi:hypothetical protein
MVETGMVVTRHTVLIEMGTYESAEQVSIEEFDLLCTLFEGMLEELEREESECSGSGKSSTMWHEDIDLDLESYLDEFDRAEIEQMRQSFGITTATP